MLIAQSGNETDQDLIAGMNLGSRQSFHALYNKYAPPLLGIISKIVKDKKTEEDVLQTSFLRIWNSRADYNPESGSLFMWLAKITRETALAGLPESQNIKIKEIRNAMNFVNIEGTFNVNSASTPHILHPTPAGTMQLPEKMLDLVFNKGCTVAEIRSGLNVTDTIVKEMLKNAINKFKRSEAV